MAPFTINLLAQDGLRNLNTKYIGQCHDFIINKGGFGCAKRGFCTENINSCTAGVLKAGEKHFMFHVAPELQPLNTVQKELEKQVNKLREVCDDIHGFICGGWALNNKDKETVGSFDLYNKIADTFDDMGIKFSMICGKDKGASQENMYSVNNRIDIWTKDLENLVPENSQPNRIIDEIENQYEFVEIAPEHTINFIAK